jgi:hypothetical protein
MEPTQNRKPRRWLWTVVVLAAVGLSFVFVAPVASVLADFARAGFFARPEPGVYTGDSEDNLRAIHRAMRLYADSEGGLPPADRWMDEVWKRLQTRDLPPEEAKKKLRAPGAGLGEWGYAYNGSLAGLHPDDIKDQSLPLVFESRDRTWNASSRNVPRGVLLVTLGGQVVRR